MGVKDHRDSTAIDTGGVKVLMLAASVMSMAVMLSLLGESKEESVPQMTVAARACTPRNDEGSQSRCCLYMQCEHMTTLFSGTESLETKGSSRDDERSAGFEFLDSDDVGMA